MIHLRLGATGRRVATLQAALGFAAPDGVFGPVTDAAVRAFQAGHGLTVDGIAGPKTLAALEGAQVPAHDPIAIARSWVGRGTPYILKNGERDCAWFVSMCLGLPRAPTKRWPWWFETTNIYTDATGKQVAFEKIDAPEPGCMVLFPDKGKGKAKNEGHIGLVTQVSPLRGIDCSSSQYKDTGDAIHERDFGFFARKVAAGTAIYARPKPA